MVELSRVLVTELSPCNIYHFHEILVFGFICSRSQRVVDKDLAQCHLETKENPVEVVHIYAELLVFFQIWNGIRKGEIHVAHPKLYTRCMVGLS